LLPLYGWCTALADIQYPSETIIIGDNSDTQTYCRYLYRRSTSSPSRHNGGGNMGLCDGHAKWYSQTELRKSMAGVAAPWRWAP
jgi:prepilin-type processing-associated H-X9-DG protein